MINDCVTEQKRKKMNRQQILDAISTMAKSQGFYRRLYDFLTNGSTAAEKEMVKLEEQNFGDIVDMVLFIEGFDVPL